MQKIIKLKNTTLILFQAEFLPFSVARFFYPMLFVDCTAIKYQPFFFHQISFLLQVQIQKTIHLRANWNSDSVCLSNGAYTKIILNFCGTWLIEVQKCLRWLFHSRIFFFSANCFYQCSTRIGGFFLYS